MKKSYVVILSILVFALSACGNLDTSLPSGKNCQVLTDSVVFGKVKVGESVTKTAAVQCMELDTLRVTVGDSTGSFSRPVDQSTVSTTTLAGTASVRVTFTPRSLTNVAGAIQFRDSRGDTYDILLAGTGSTITSETSELAPTENDTEIKENGLTEQDNLF